MSAPLAQSADKQVLFARLGLDEPTHKLLLAEAQKARDELSSNPNNLTGESRVDPSVRRPYKWDQISETAKHYWILRIVQYATPQTKPYYAIGRHGTINEENWVARWYLWHSFRYRDNRPDSRARLAADNGHQEHEARGRHNNAGSKFWDPVLEVWR